MTSKIRSFVILADLPPMVECDACLTQRYMSPRVVTAVAENPTACEVFHIPFQSGNNEVLKRMGRGYTREKYLSIVQRIRDELGDGPAVSITADLIVGFPGTLVGLWRSD